MRAARRPGRLLSGATGDLLGRVAPISPAVEGWASRSLASALSSIFLLATAGWQLVVICTVVASPRPLTPLLPLLAAHIVTLVAALSARAGRLPAWVPVVAVYALFVADWSAADSMDDPLLFASCWMTNLANATPAFVLRGRRAIVLPALASVLLPASMVLLRPDLPATLPVAVFLTLWSIVLATRIGLSYLADFAALVDAETRASRREQAAVETQAAASRAAAEDARMLHDTVINTLAAIASGGGAVRDLAVVRERCARDIAAVAALHVGAEPTPDDGGLRSATYDARVRVLHQGLGDEELAGLEAQLAPARLRALRRATVELVQNAAKHAGVDEVRVRAEERGGALVVTVADDGVGFDRRTVAAGGLADSVAARAREADLDLDLDTAPGAGTRVTLTARRSPASGRRSLGDRGDIARVVRVLRRRACLLYGVGVSAVGFVLAMGNHPGEATPEYPMATIAALGVALGWWCTRDRRRLPGWAVVVLVAAAPAAFLLSAISVDYGRHDAVLWQAIGATGLLVVVAELAPRPTALVWAGLAYGAVVVTVAAEVGRSTPAAGAIVLTAGTAGLGLAVAWRRFQHVIGAIGVRAAADERAAWSARIRLAERRAAERSRERWRAAGLDRSLALLETIRDGADPASPDLRSRCAEEEAYLRQLTLLPTELVHMGQWFAQALNTARDRGVRLVVRAGSADLSTPDAAGVGALLLEAVAATPGGQDFTVTLFPGPNGARVTLVGAHPHVADAVRAATGTLAATARVTSVAGQDVAEIDLAGDRPEAG